VLNFHFSWYCLRLKANFQKKNCGNTSTKGFLGLFNKPSSGICYVLFLTQHNPFFHLKATPIQSHHTVYFKSYYQYFSQVLTPLNTHFHIEIPGIMIKYTFQINFYAFKNITSNKVGTFGTKYESTETGAVTQRINNS